MVTTPVSSTLAVNKRTCDNTSSSIISMELCIKILSVIFFLSSQVSSICYFPAVYQGEYVSQAVGAVPRDQPLSSPIISYSTISVLYDSIPVWGYCHKRIGSNVILMDDTGGITCYRCFHLSLRSSNVLQIHTRGIDTCFTTEEAAQDTCVSSLEMYDTSVSEVMMYRTKGFLGEPAVSPTYCPFNGAYSFTYSINDGSETQLECDRPVSTISDCPYGFGFNLQFRQCSFGPKDISFHCLGDWDGQHGERYVALMDTEATLTSIQEKPRYRCAIYKEDPVTGKIRMALSSDSTCVSQLHSADRGYETLVLHPNPQPSWPQHLTSSCIFPEWLQGKWEHLDFDGDTVIYKDHRTFKTYTGKCVPHNTGHEDRFLLYTRTQCGDEEYKCMWVKERGVNTMEVQVSLYTSETHNDSLCGHENFQERTWTTQGRIDISETAPYMFTGEYTGVIPDTEGLCAKLYSDCNNPEIMFYTIFNCFNRTEVFEEREYQCLGQWEEDGVIYTYTERRDMDGYECFVGVERKKGEIFLQEAGNNCERGQEPIRYGMRMSRVAQCYYHPRFHWPPSTASPNTARRETTTRPGPGSGAEIVKNIVSLMMLAVILTLSNN